MNTGQDCLIAFVVTLTYIQCQSVSYSHLFTKPFFLYIFNHNDHIMGIFIVFSQNSQYYSQKCRSCVASSLAFSYTSHSNFFLNHYILFLNPSHIIINE